MAKPPRYAATLGLALALAVLAVVIVLGLSAFNRGERDAQRTELQHIQLSVTLVMAENDITYLPHPVAEPTNAMDRFPDVDTSPIDKGLGVGDKPGYLLFGHDKVADGGDSALVNYLNFAKSRWLYTVTKEGIVSQVAGGGE